MRRSFLLPEVLLLCVFVTCALVFAGCPREPRLFHITFPTNSQDWDYNAQNQLVLTVRFNRDVDMTSLLPGINVILDTDNVPNAAISIDSGMTAREVVITSDQTMTELLSAGDAYFELTLKGSGASPVRSRGLIRLDGNKDGVEGGDFTHGYVRVG